MFRIYPLPPEQEAHEVGGANGFDLRPEPIQGVAVNPRKQPAVAPLENRGSRSEPAAESPSLTPSVLASSAAVVGPTISRRPRSNSRIASSRVGTDETDAAIGAGRAVNNSS